MAIAKKKVVTVHYEEDIEQIATILGKKQIKRSPLSVTVCWSASSAAAM